MEKFTPPTAKEKREMFQRALRNNPDLTFADFEEKLKANRNPALSKANPNAQIFRTINDVVTEYKSKEEMNHTFTESDSFDNDNC